MILFPASVLQVPGASLKPIGEWKGEKQCEIQQDHENNFQSWSEVSCYYNPSIRYAFRGRRRWFAFAPVNCVASNVGESLDDTGFIVRS